MLLGSREGKDNLQSRYFVQAKITLFNT